MIQQIINTLNRNKDVSEWKLMVTKSQSKEAFFVLGQLETTRATDTTDYDVTVYRRIEQGDEVFLGSATVTIPHKMTDQELDELINRAVYSASLVKNKYFELVQGDEPRTWEDETTVRNPFNTLDQIANVFFNVSTKERKFNSLELFYNVQTTLILNSKGVDYTKTLNTIEVEAIPSYDGEKQKVEIYKYYRYKQVDLDHIQKDALDALDEVEARYRAEDLKDIKKLHVILRDNDVLQLVRELISTSSYESVYKGSALYTLNDSIQKDGRGDRLTISLTPSSKTDGFDSDGVLLDEVKVVDEGKLINYYGNNQYAYYLGVKPTGNLRFTKVQQGTVSIEDMKKEPHLEILSLSGLQLDIYNGYIGGEVRLANYFDGEKTTPLSSFSFSGNLNDVLKDIVLSKETYTSSSYEGPKYLLLKAIEVQ